ncbi:MAG: adenine phosphoribosyltransferase [Candidatus Nealsonbacteria bacterium]|nr:adenine phosphoribosyltransferase [Candidatus Nealsonbacteria bacterium]
MPTDFKEKIRSVPDFPEKGVTFRDITPVLNDPKVFRKLIDKMSSLYKGKKIDIVVGIDARGFLLASPVAYKLNAGLAIVRKKGKLPFKCLCQDYSLEYGKSSIEMHVDAVKPGQRVLLIDDVIATGGTIRAAADLVEKLGGKIVGVLFFIELKGLKGKEKLKQYPIQSIVKY